MIKRRTDPGSVIKQDKGKSFVLVLYTYSYEINKEKYDHSDDPKDKQPARLIGDGIRVF